MSPHAFRIGFWTLRLLVVFALLLPVPPTRVARAAGFIHVTPTGAASGACGDTWANACELQYALTTVSATGDEIWAAAGIYYPTTGYDRSATFQLKSGVGIYGGFAGNETARSQRSITANVTTLSGEIGLAGSVDNSFHVVTGSGTDNTAVLDGFTVSGGNANLYPADNGGGMYNSSGSPALTNVTFSHNSASDTGDRKYGGNGGGMYNVSSSSPTLTNVTFSGNTAESNGGGMYNSSGSPALTNVTFNGNWAAIEGGGMYNQDSSPALTNVTFNGNSVRSSGGGMYNEYSSPTLTNVTFSGNSANVGGGGIYNDDFSRPIIRNSIVWGNTASYSAQVFNSGFNNLLVSDSVDQDGCPFGSTCTNLITADPHLVGLGDDGVLVHALGSGSSAINTANVAYCPATDQRGYPRRGAGGFCDIGAYEAQPTSVVATNGSPQSAAINTAFPVALQVRVADSYGNLLGGSAVTFSVPASGASAAWNGSLAATRTTGLDGIATAPTLMANGTPGAFPASAATQAGAATFVLANLKGDTTTAITSAQNPSHPGAAVAFTVTVTSPSGTPAGTVAFYEMTSPAGPGARNRSLRSPWSTARPPSSHPRSRSARTACWRFTAATPITPPALQRCTRRW